MRKLIILALLNCGLLWAADEPKHSCLIVKHATAARQLLLSNASWQYVAGEFPKGMKFKADIKDKDVRKIKDSGGKVVVVPQDYGTADLEAAKRECQQ
jgi:hypothetical protein